MSGNSSNGPGGVAQDIPSIIIDSGSHTTRAGFSGDEMPKLIFPSFINKSGKGAQFGLESLTRPTAEPEALWEVTAVQQPNGGTKHVRSAKSKDNVEALFSYIFERLGVDKEDATTLAPVLLVDPQPPYSPETQSFIAQMLFEKFNIPGVYFAASAALNAFAAGKHSAIVVDVGASGSSVVGVSEGLVSLASWQPLGGDYLTAACQRLLTDLGQTELYVHEQVASKEPVEMGKPPVFTPNTSGQLTEAALEYQRRRLVEDWKASVAQVAEFASSDSELALKPPKFYEFPDGYNRNYGAERFRIGELLVQGAQNKDEQDEGGLMMGLVEQIEKVHSGVDSHSASNIIVSGGGSLLEGLGERLSNELGARLQRGYGRGSLKVSHAGSALERHHACWIGGSILTSIGSFHKIWVTKQEFIDCGMAAFSKRPYASHLALP